jgi:hypothetical protein
VLSDGTRARVTGTITCDEGNRYRIGVRLTQGEAAGQGIATGNCTGDPQSFRVIVRASAGPRFQDGTAQANAVAQIGDGANRVIVDRFSTSEEVEIDIPGGMMAPMLRAIDANESRRG